MPTPDFNIVGQIEIDKISENAAMRRIQNLAKNTPVIRLKVDSGPLGRITSEINQFNKSLDAATSRVAAFTLTTSAIYGVGRAFTEIGRTFIEVESKFKSIQVVLNTTVQGFEKFKKSVYDAAKLSGQSFTDAADAAIELARQGLGAAETVNRLNASLILARQSGLSVQESVSGLTATLNTFQKEALSAFTILNKLANVDASFAVSSGDLIQALSRAGAAAQDAGVGFDQFISFVTSLQQTTARGGAVIGNSLKSIFTRIERSTTLDALEQFNVSTRDLQGNVLSADVLLKNLADTYKILSRAEQNAVSERAAGIQQINQLKALLSDLARTNSIYAQSLDIAGGSTNEAIERNKLLNETLKSQLNAVSVSATQFSSIVGKLTFQPVIKSGGNILNDIFGSFENQEADSKGVGQKIGESLLKGIGAALSGPGLVLGASVLFNIFRGLTRYATGIIADYSALNQQTKEHGSLQSAITQILASGNQQYIQRINAAKTLKQEEEAIRAILLEINGLELRRHALFSQSTKNLIGNSGGVRVSDSQGIRVTKGVPNLANPVAAAIGRESAAGVPISQIRVASSPRLSSPTNPNGLAVINTRDEPGGIHQGINRAISEGKNPKTYGLPNFANLYHGSNDKLSEIFDELYLTSDSGAAKSYGKNLNKIKISDKAKNLNLKDLKEVKNLYPDFKTDNLSFVFEALDDKNLRDSIRKDGYDSVSFEDILPNSSGDKTHDATLLLNSKLGKLIKSRKSNKIPNFAKFGNVEISRGDIDRAKSIGELREILSIVEGAGGDIGVSTADISKVRNLNTLKTRFKAGIGRVELQNFSSFRGRVTKPTIEPPVTQKSVSTSLKSSLDIALGTNQSQSIASKPIEPLSALSVAYKKSDSIIKQRQDDLQKVLSIQRGTIQKFFDDQYSKNVSANIDKNLEEAGKILDNFKIPNSKPPQGFNNSFQKNQAVFQSETSEDILNKISQKISVENSKDVGFRGFFKGIGSTKRTKTFANNLLSTQGKSLSGESRGKLDTDISNLLTNQSDRRRHRLQNAALTASFGLPIVSQLATSFAPNEPGVGRQAAGVGGAIGTGASVAGILGFSAPGLAIGALVASVQGLKAVADGGRKSIEDYANELENVRGGFEDQKNTLVGLFNSQDQIQDIIARGGSNREIGNVSQQLQTSIRGIQDSGLRGKAIGAKTVEDRADILTELSARQVKQVSEKGLASLLENIVAPKRGVAGDFISTTKNILLKDTQRNDLTGLVANSLPLKRDEAGNIDKNQLSKLNDLAKQTNVSFQDLENVFGRLNIDAESRAKLETQIARIEQEAIAKSIVQRSIDAATISKETENLQKYNSSLLNIGRTLQKLQISSNLKLGLNDVNNQGSRGRAIAGATQSLGAIGEFLSPQNLNSQDNRIKSFDVQSENISNLEQISRNFLTIIDNLPQELQDAFKSFDSETLKARGGLATSGEQLKTQLRNIQVEVLNEVLKPGGNAVDASNFSKDKIASLINEIGGNKNNSKIVEGLENLVNKNLIGPAAQESARNNQAKALQDQTNAINKLVIDLNKKLGFLGGGNFENTRDLDLSRISAGSRVGASLRSDNGPFQDRIFKSRGNSFDDFFKPRVIDESAENSRRSTTLGTLATGQLDLFKLGLLDNDPAGKNKARGVVAQAEGATILDRLNELERGAQASGDLDLLSQVRGFKNPDKIAEIATLKASKQIPLEQGQENIFGKLSEAITKLPDSFKLGIQGDFNKLITSADLAAQSLIGTSEAAKLLSKILEEQKLSEGIVKQIDAEKATRTEEQNNKAEETNRSVEKANKLKTINIFGPDKKIFDNKIPFDRTSGIENSDFKRFNEITTRFKTDKKVELSDYVSELNSTLPSKSIRPLIEKSLKDVNEDEVEKRLEQIEKILSILNGKNVANGFIPNIPEYAGGLLGAFKNESNAIKSGIGGAKAGDKPYVTNLDGVGPAVVNTGETVIRNFSGGKDAVFNRAMKKSAGLNFADGKLGPYDLDLDKMKPKDIGYIEGELANYDLAMIAAAYKQGGPAAMKKYIDQINSSKSNGLVANKFNGLIPNYANGHPGNEIDEFYEEIFNTSKVPDGSDTIGELNNKIRNTIEKKLQNSKSLASIESKYGTRDKYGGNFNFTGFNSFPPKRETNTQLNSILGNFYTPKHDNYNFDAVRNLVNPKLPNTTSLIQSNLSKAYGSTSVPKVNKSFGGSRIFDDKYNNDSSNFRRRFDVNDPSNNLNIRDRISREGSAFSPVSLQSSGGLSTGSLQGSRRYGASTTLEQREADARRDQSKSNNNYNTNINANSNPVVIAINKLIAKIDQSAQKETSDKQKSGKVEVDQNIKIDISGKIDVNNEKVKQIVDEEISKANDNIRNRVSNLESAQKNNPNFSPLPPKIGQTAVDNSVNS